MKKLKCEGGGKRDKPVKFSPLGKVSPENATQQFPFICHWLGLGHNDPS